LTTATTAAALTPPQVAKLLAVDVDRVRRWIRSGRLRGIDVSENPGTGRPRFRVMREDLDAFMAGRIVGPPPPRRPRRRTATIKRTYY